MKTKYECIFCNQAFGTLSEAKGIACSKPYGHTLKLINSSLGLTRIVRPIVRRRRRYSI